MEIAADATLTSEFANVSLATLQMERRGTLKFQLKQKIKLSNLTVQKIHIRKS